jgi:hypothetical protein
MFYIGEIMANQINNKDIQITTICCVMNLIKFFHIIVFDEKLIDIFLEYKFLLFFKNILNVSVNSKIIYTNFYINPFEKFAYILKTIPETIMDTCIKLINSNI